MPGTLSPLPNVRTARSMRREGIRRVHRHPRPVAQQGGFGKVALVGKTVPIAAQPNR
jgi:hypothetical protein